MPLNIDWQQILLHFFNFVLLFGILYLLLYKPVHDFMEKRMAEYEDDERKTKENLDESEKLRQEYSQKLADFEVEKAKMRAEVGALAQEQSRQIVEAANEKADAILAAASERAEKEHDRRIAMAESEIADLVAGAAEKIVMGQSDEDGFDSFFQNTQKM